MLYSAKAYAFLEKLCYKLPPTSTHGIHKSNENEWTCVPVLQLDSSVVRR